MKVLTICAHHNPRSLCHAVLDRFSAGLRDAGHTSEFVDLYAIAFDPMFSERDGPNWVDDSVPDDAIRSPMACRVSSKAAHRAAAAARFDGRPRAPAGSARPLPVLTALK